MFHGAIQKIKVPRFMDHGVLRTGKFESVWKSRLWTCHFQVVGDRKDRSYIIGVSCALQEQSGDRLLFW